MERPEIVEDEHLTYLDRLRERGTTNMLGAGEYLEASFGVSKEEARLILTHWMDTFSERHAA